MIPSPDAARLLTAAPPHPGLGRRLLRLCALASILLPSLALAQLRGVETAHGTFLSCDVSTGIAGAVELNGVAVNMQFQMIHNADGTWSFKRGDVYLTAEIELESPDGSAVPVSCDRTALGAWEKFTLVETGTAGIHAFRSHHGYFLAAEPDGSLVANRPAVGPWEGFGFWTLTHPNWWNVRGLGEFCDGAPFEPLPDAPPPPPSPERALRTAHDTWLLCGEGQVHQSAAFDDPVGDGIPSTGRWAMLDHGDGTWSLRVVSTGTYLTASPDGSLRCDANAIGLWERFTRDDLAGSLAAFQSVHGDYVCAQNDGTVVADRVEALAWEQFELWLFSTVYAQNAWGGTQTHYTAASPE